MEKKPTYEELEAKINSLESKLSKLDALEENVKVNNSFLKMLFDTIPSPMFYKDINGVYQHCNDAFSKTILGIPKEKIIGKTLYDLPDLIPKEYADLYAKKDSELFINPGVQFYEGKVKCSDEKVRNYNFYKSTFIMDDKVLGLVGVMLDVSDYKKALGQLDAKNKVLNDLSITDWLTGLNNRRYFQEIFLKKLSLLNRHKHKFAFAIIDIDFFKDYNDCYGHHEGDLALQKVACVMKSTLNRPNDYCFRLGGEEFGILFDVESSKDSFSLVEKLRKNIENLKLETANTTVSPYLSISIGVGNIKHINIHTDTSSIYDKVDKLLYLAKDYGRNQVVSKDIIIP